MVTRNLLKKVARIYGIQTSYKNIDNNFITAPEKTLLKMISDLSGEQISSDRDLQNIFAKKIQNLTNDKAPKVLILWQNEKTIFHIYSNSKIEDKLNFENDANILIECHKLSEVKHETYIKNTFEVLAPNLDVGYYHFSLKIEDIDKKVFVVLAPSKLAVNEGEKQWGPFVPLYALRSNSDWGIGTFKELKEIAPLLKDNGASWVSLLPILAGNFDPEDCDPSPYSSLTRLFWNEIYLDIPRLLKKYSSQKANSLIESESFKNKISTLKNMDFVDYHQCYKLKKEVLLILSDLFFEKKLDQSDAYLEFVKNNPSIHDYAKFRTTDLRAANFHKFAQFEINIELSTFKEETGLSLYMDYPVGVNDAGFDFARFSRMFFKEVSVGAPPEPVFALGQDWGFPSFHPENMIDDEYKYFRDSVINHLKYSSILRLDHVMGLHRIYSVPKGYGGDNGAYLRFPKDHLFSIVITEAYLAGVDVIGENLGTVPLTVEKTINDRNLNGMWVMQCETWRSREEALKAIKANQLICINTHDMPMLANFVKTNDLDQVCELKILSESYKNKFKVERKEQMQNWKASSPDFISSLYTDLAKSSAKYFVANLEDLWSEERSQNIPGTWKEYPNWRKKFSVECEAFKDQAVLMKCLSTLKEFRG